MKHKLTAWIALWLLATSTLVGQTKSYTIVIHGGAGTITAAGLSAAEQQAYALELENALAAAQTVLENNGRAVDAVVAAIEIMEASPLFNAGKGAVFTNKGTNELDASIMDGANKKAGAVAGLQGIKSPINAARAVMDNSEHVMLSGEGARKFALEQNLDTANADYFYTPKRWKSLENTRNIEQTKKSKNGTVGCVVLDTYGNLAAGTSTGGMTNKRFGRIGDSPVIGAGTYAENESCAVSCTGHGEFFIRYAVAYDLAARIKYKGETLAEAANYIINNQLVQLKASGGLIAVDKQGNVAMPFNSDGMFRGYIKNTGNKIDRKVLMFKE